MLYEEWLSYVSGPLQSRMLCFQSTASFTEPLGNSMNIDQSPPILTTLSSSYRHIIFLLLSTFSKKVEYILFLVVICYIFLLNVISYLLIFLSICGLFSTKNEVKYWFPNFYSRIWTLSSNTEMKYSFYLTHARTQVSLHFILRNHRLKLRGKLALFCLMWNDIH